MVKTLDRRLQTGRRLASFGQRGRFVCCFRADGHTLLDMGIASIRHCEINNPYEHEYENGCCVYNYTDLH